MLTGTPAGKRSLGRWEDNIIMDLKVIVINTKDCVDLAQDRDYQKAFVTVTLNLRDP